MYINERRFEDADIRRSSSMLFGVSIFTIHTHTHTHTYIHAQEVTG